MIRVYLIIYFCLGLVFVLLAQSYRHSIIAYDGNPAFSQLEIEGEKLFIPILQSGDTMSVIVIEEDQSIANYQFDSISISAHGMQFVTGKYLFYGKQRSAPRDLRILTTDNFLNRESITQFSYHGDFDFPTSATIVKDELFMTYLFDDLEANTRRIGLAKYNDFSEMVQLVDTYNDEIELSLPWNLISTNDDNLLMSNGIHYFDKLGRFSQLIKLDTLGDIIWSVEGEDRFSSGSASALVAELSNGNIVQVYKIDKSQDLEFLNMGFGWYPTQFNYFESDGTAIKDTIFGAPDNVDFTILKLIEGNGEYFFLQVITLMQVVKITMAY